MNSIQSTICAGLLLLGLAGGSPLWAGENQREFALEVNQANQLLRGGDADGAIDIYREAQSLAPENADLSYNTAVAQYRKGDVAAAENLFQSASTANDDALAARARYNLGNCNYAAALQSAEQDRPAAIEQLEKAIANYRSALAIEPADADARANIELAAQLIEQLREEQEQQEQQQQEQQQNQDQQQQSRDEKQDQQDQQQDENSAQEKSNEESPSGKQSQDEQTQDEQSSQSESQSKPQSEPDAQSQDQQQSSSKEITNEDQSQDSQSQQPQSPSQQQAAKKPPQSQEQNPPSPADEPEGEQGQQPPQGELTTAGDEEAKADEQKQQGVAAFDPSRDGEMTQQEAEKMLQAIRDRDMLRRLRRQAAEQNQHVPVDRDW